MKEVPSPETMSHEQYIREKLLPDVRENGTGPKCHVGLRDAMYARSRDSKIAYVMNQQHPQVDDPFDYVDFVNEQKAFRQAYRNCPITELPIHAVQTGRCYFSATVRLDCRGLNNSIRNWLTDISRCTANVTPSANIRYPNNSWDLNAFTDRYYQKGGGRRYVSFSF